MKDCAHCDAPAVLEKTITEMAVRCTVCRAQMVTRYGARDEQAKREALLRDWNRRSANPG